LPLVPELGDVPDASQAATHDGGKASPEQIVAAAQRAGGRSVSYTSASERNRAGGRAVIGVGIKGTSGGKKYSQ